MTYDTAQAPPGAAVAWYFYLTGTASGAALVAGLARLFGDDMARRAAGPSRYIAFPLAAAAGLLPAVGATEIGPDGARALAAFMAIAFVGFLGALVEDGWVKGPHASIRGGVTAACRGRAGAIFEAIGAFAAVVVGAGAGPLSKSSGWIGDPWLGPLFLASAVSTGAAALVVVARRLGDEGEAQIDRLETIDGVAILAEIATLVAFAFSLRGTEGLALMRWPGMLVPLFVVPFGLVLPLLLRQARGPGGAVDSALMVLFGGFVLRFAVLGMPPSLAAAVH